MYANGIDKIWAADLVDVRNFSKFNKGIQYLLTVIDIFSKYGWIIPINNKSGKEVKKALQIILKERQPSKMWVDKGKEFYNKDVQSLIELYSTVIKLELQRKEEYLIRDMHQDGLKRCLQYQIYNSLTHQLIKLLIITMKKYKEHFMNKNCKSQIRKYIELKR